jgi:sugar lactone lactonase YvrE
VDIAWGPKGSLYVLEITSAGLTSGDPTGALIRVEADGDKEVVASTGLVTPTAVAISDDGWLYVSNYGTSAGKGTVVRIGRA